MYDLSAPQSLVQIQKWFGSVISRPLNKEGKIQETTCRLVPIEKESAQFIRSSKTLKSHERIQLYNQQYWWRLIDCLQESFPLTTRLFGYQTFNNQMAIPFLNAHPPSSWSLNRLGEGFAKWLGEKGEEKGAASAALDWAYEVSFTAAHHPSIREVGGDPSEWLSAPLTLEPHLQLLSVPYPFLRERKGILREKPPYWETHPLPSIEKKQTFYAVYRDQHNHIPHKILDAEEWEVLQAIKGGKSLEQASSTLDEKEGEKLAFWVQDWVLRDWLYAVA